MPHIITKHGQYDHTVEVFIVCNNKVLLRNHQKYGLWLGIGGHIELNEDPNQAATREVIEEVGLDIKLISPRPIPNNSGLDNELIPPFYLNSHPIDKNHNHSTFIYFATSTSQKVIPEPGITEWKWLSRKELENNSLQLQENIKFYALEALKTAK